MEERKEERVRSVSQGIQPSQHPGWGLYNDTFYAHTPAMVWLHHSFQLEHRRKCLLISHLSYEKNNQKHKTWILKLLLREEKGYLRMRLRKDYTDLFKERPEGTAFLILFGSIHWQKKERKKKVHVVLYYQKERKKATTLFAKSLQSFSISFYKAQVCMG